MKNEESEVSVMIETAREMIKMPNLNSSEKLLGRIIVRTIMSIAQPDMLSEDELETLRLLSQKIGLSEDDIVRMVASIMADRLMQKLKDIGGDDYLASFANA